ncbi:hypothetical protein SPLC1_S501420 [Arthrospira platensis C1]|nr:hypothetical protein SPLC1_S501420 [Arthrospira platensis C1]
MVLKVGGIDTLPVPRQKLPTSATELRPDENWVFSAGWSLSY